MMSRRLTKAEARQLGMPGICEHGMTLPQIFFIVSQKAAALGVTAYQVSSLIILYDAISALFDAFEKSSLVLFYLFKKT